MSIDTKDYGQSVPESLTFGKDKILLHKNRKAPNFLTITFNPAKIINGHNLYLLKPDDNCEIIQGIIEHLASSFGSDRFLTPENWNLIQIELSQNRQITDPFAFVFSHAKIAHLHKCSRVHTRGGFHTVVYGPKTCELKLYAKGPQFKRVYGRAFPELMEEANQIVRFERVSNKSGIENLLGNRLLSTFLDFLPSDQAQKTMESTWDQLPKTKLPTLSILTESILQKSSPTQTRSILGYHYLAQEIGESSAAQKLRISRNTVFKFKKILSEFP